MSERFLDCLKRERDISIKPMLSGVKMVFRQNPALSERLEQVCNKFLVKKWSQDTLKSKTQGSVMPRCTEGRLMPDPRADSNLSKCPANADGDRRY